MRNDTPSVNLFICQRCGKAGGTMIKVPRGGYVHAFHSPCHPKPEWYWRRFKRWLKKQIRKMDKRMRRLKWWG